MKMNTYIILLLMAFPSYGFGQYSPKFMVKEIMEHDSLNTLNKKDFEVDPNNIYEDSFYLISKSCSGEWGGTIRFKNKETGMEYSAASTCPVVVNKLNGKYYITNTLAHLSGSSEILEIGDPEEMTPMSSSKPRGRKKKVNIRYVGDDESKSNVGVKQLVDSIGVLTLASFPYEGQLYHIVTDFKETFVAKIVGHQFVSIEKVSKHSLWTYSPEVYKTPGQHFIVFFENEQAKGYLDIFKNQISVIRLK